jgi:hypothetical protein
MVTPEAQARQQMDAALNASGWIVQDYKTINLAAGKDIAVRRVPLEWGRCGDSPAAVCEPFDSTDLRERLFARPQPEQTFDAVTVDTAMEQGFDSVAKEKAEAVVRDLRSYLEE